MKRMIAAIGGLAALTAPAVAHAGWSKAYVAEWFEPAFYYGAKTGIIEPGTDCPAGTNKEPDWFDLLKTTYRTDEEIKVILDPEKSQKNRVGGIRGPNRENVYIQPWSVPDPGMPEMTGTLSYGFDLDNNPATGYTSPDGKVKGIDNAYYKAAGCWKAWRGPTRQAHHAIYVNDGMRDGVMSVVVIVSGEGADPANDPNVTVGFYLSKDKMVKDANGGIARDFTFRIDPDQRFQSLIKARTVDGVVESTQQADLKLRDVETAGFFPAQLMLYKGKVRIDPKEDGKAFALVGGYRPVNDYWTGWAASGTIHESTTHVNLPAYWYALQRNADLAAPGAERKNAISTAYHMYLTPAFLIAPDAKSHVTAARLYPPAQADAAPAPRPQAALAR